MMALMNGEGTRGGYKALSPTVYKHKTLAATRPIYRITKGPSDFLIIS
jgi:hypothetical protein